MEGLQQSANTFLLQTAIAMDRQVLNQNNASRQKFLQSKV